MKKEVEDILLEDYPKFNFPCPEEITPLMLYDEDEEGISYTIDENTYTPAVGFIYYHDKNGDIQKSEETTLTSYALTDAVSAFIQVYRNANANKNIPEYFISSKDTTIWIINPNYKTRKEAANEAKEAAEKAYAAWKSAVETESSKKTAWENAVAGVEADKEAYKTINIAADFNAPATTFDKWPAGYTLNGNGHIIETTGALFKINEGEINGLATPNGHIANSNPGTVTLSLTKWDELYRVYKASGEYTNYDTAEDAIYSMRNTASFKFGYDIKTGTVKTLSDATKLYEAKYANASNKSGYTFRFNLKDDNLVYDTEAFNNNIKGGYTLQNAMLYIENNDVTNAVKEQTNVAVKNGNAYVCKNVKLEEGAGIKEFYISENVKATNLSYGRDFKQKVVAVCLPFELSADYIETQNIEVYQFNKVDANGVMWFTEKGSIAANKPCLIRFSGEQGDGAIFNKLSEQLLEKTPAELVENIGEYKFCGTYASAYPADLIGNTQGVLYGVQNGGLVKTDANSTSRLHQFRSYVWQPNAVSANAAPSYKIGLMDEDGNELSTAIETVTGEIVSGFKAKGGDSAVEITTDKACQVKVYTLSGALVKSTHVEAGSTSLPVKAGIYVVNGTKVIVK